MEDEMKFDGNTIDKPKTEEQSNELRELKEEFKEIAFKAFIAHSKGDTENALIYKTQALKLMERIKAIEEEKTKYNPKR